MNNKKVIIKECPCHGLTEFIEDNNGKFRCKKCRVDAVSKKRKENKLKLVEYKGGKCEICGYDKCIDALEFHHLNPEEKEFGISNGNIKSFEKLKLEADKCILVCSNCHREIHSSINKEKNVKNSSMGKVRKIDTLDINLIKIDLKNQLTREQIAKKYNVSLSTVKRFLKINKENIK